MRSRERGPGKTRLLARGSALVDALLQQEMGVRPHDSRAHKAAVRLGLAEPAQDGRLSREVCPRVIVSLLEGPRHRRHPHRGTLKLHIKSILAFATVGEALWRACPRHRATARRSARPREQPRQEARRPHPLPPGARISRERWHRYSPAPPQAKSRPPGREAPPRRDQGPPLRKCDRRWPEDVPSVAARVPAQERLPKRRAEVRM